MRRAHLSGEALELSCRRAAVVSLFAWLPLLILSALNGHAWGTAVRVPFLLDVEVHARLLLALPLLIFAEVVAHRWVRPVARQFLERGLIPDTSRPRFDAIVPSLMRLRDSRMAEVLLIGFVYVVGTVYLWPIFGVLDVASWYALPSDGGRRLSPAGLYFVYVSLPLLQFIVFRWYFRLFVWTCFLWRISRCQLRLVPTHPDRAGGLGFLATTVMAFAPLLAAHGAWLSGLIADRIFYQGATLPAFKVELAAFVAFLLLMTLGPLVLFAPHLLVARRVGLREYGGLAQRYAREFDAKWLRGGAAADHALLGSGDIQSLADMGNSFQIVEGMRVVPFTKKTVLQLAVITLLPVAPLLLTMVSVEELLKRLLPGVP
jgi:hypothetical protein